MRALYQSAAVRLTLPLLVLLLLSPLAAAQDSQNWPREIETEKGLVVIYQPQLESFEEDDLRCRAAVQIDLPDRDPVFGAVWIECRIVTDLETRLVSLADVRVPEVKFPTLAEAEDPLAGFLEKEIPTWELDLTIEELTASLAAVEERHRAASRLSNDPPVIRVSREPAVLVLVDGDPALMEIENTKYRYVANSPFFIATDGSGWYLEGGGRWWRATGVEGPWNPDAAPPGDLAEMVKKAQEDALKDLPTDEEAGSPDALSDVVPRILVSLEPAELIEIDGEPDWAAVEGSTLLALRNSNSDIFLDVDTQDTYALFSGRWFRTAKLEDRGTWSYVGEDDLPAAFAAIPVESEVAGVRASVPGTDESREAIMEAQVPQTATVVRDSATVEVSYDGDPKWADIEDTGLQRAENSSQTVIRVDGVYYVCADAIWFTGGSPTGPWKVADTIPAAIYSIPANDPAHNVTYVHVYESTPEVVYVGYTPGYTGTYVYGSTVVYGTGWWWPGWYHTVYYPRPWTWGFHVTWTPYYGFNYGFSVGFGYSWFRVGFGYPAYGGWWGPAGWHYRAGYGHGYHHGYRHGYSNGYRAGYVAGRMDGRSPRPNLYAGSHTGVRPDRRPSTRPGVRPDRVDRPTSRPSTGPATRPTTRPSTQPSTRPETRPTTRPQAQPSRPNNVYTDRSGNVYRKDGNNWQQRDRSNWSNQNRMNDRTRQELNRQSHSRDRGATMNRSRPSTGASRGGGRRR